jgi:3'(2'), 5'-bisphosphate nucleotidase
MTELETLLMQALDAALEAGAAIRDVYRRDFKVTTKADLSPLTEADRCSHEIIVHHLETTGIPILSEEGRDIPYDERSGWNQLWIVDPLDGTKEFVKRNGEFTVNIALVTEQQPVLGVVLAPDKGRVYVGVRGLGAYKISLRDLRAIYTKQTGGSAEGISWDALAGAGTLMPLPEAKPDIYTIVGSRSHATPELEAFVEAKRKEHSQIEFISAGSSLKICLVAEGAADIYPRLGPTMEWDTAAGQAVVEAAGGKLIDYQTLQPLPYNREALLNPWFYVLGPEGKL